MTLSVTIAPAGAAALVQTGFAIQQTSDRCTPDLTNNSTAGTCLIAWIGNQYGIAISKAPTGWVLLGTATQAAKARLEVWAYPNNPGGIKNTEFVGTPGLPNFWTVQIAEFSGVDVSGTIDASGTATATAGTALVLTTATNVTTVGCVALAAWVQQASTTATFTQPAGWTQIPNDGLITSSIHEDGEYQLTPGVGAPLSVTMTSTLTTVSAAGVIVVLRPTTASADQSAYVQYGSVYLKLNTLDLTLIDCPTVIAPLSRITLSDPGNYPDWTGLITQVRASDLLNRRTGHKWQIITASNSLQPNYTNAPYVLTDNPGTNTNDVWLLENGDSWELENNTGNWLLESNTQENGYHDLTVGVQVAQTSPSILLTTQGELTAYAPALWPGMTFQLVSLNLNSSLANGGLYTIQTIAITYQGVPPVPVYQIQFGDRIQTLSGWTEVAAAGDAP